jgi:hypothetical protein
MVSNDFGGSGGEGVGVGEEGGEGECELFKKTEVVGEEWGLGESGCGAWVEALGKAPVLGLIAVMLEVELVDGVSRLLRLSCVAARVRKRFAGPENCERRAGGGVEGAVDARTG